MAESTHRVAIMFADMTGSTRLYDDVGNTAAIDVVSLCLHTLSQVVVQFRGTVIKTIGDEVMCSFPTAASAALASSEMHLAVRKLGEDRGALTQGIQVKVGAHYGEVIEEDGDIFGDAVNVAARMASLAKADQTLVTEAVIEELPAELRSTLRYYDKVELKGKVQQVDAYEIIWEVSDMTVAASSTPTVERVEHSTLVLSSDSHRISLGAEGLGSASMGRADDNTIQCRGALTSRKHARVEYKRGRFTITDQSANGTHIKPDHEDAYALRREYSQLEGGGYIGLGEDPRDMGDLAIRYDVD